MRDTTFEGAVRPSENLHADRHSRFVTLTVQVIAITDGEPAGEPNTTVLNVIKNAKTMCANSPYGPGAIAFEFAQVRAG